MDLSFNITSYTFIWSLVFCILWVLRWIVLSFYEYMRDTLPWFAYYIKSGNTNLHCSVTSILSLIPPLLFVNDYTWPYFWRASLGIQFPVTANLGVSNLPVTITELEEQVKHKNWEKERLLEDIKRQEDLLNQVKDLFSKKKEQFMAYITQPGMLQVNLQFILLFSWLY